jgi:hypothetical protein
MSFIDLDTYLTLFSIPSLVICGYSFHSIKLQLKFIPVLLCLVICSATLLNASRIIWALLDPGSVLFLLGPLSLYARTTVGAKLMAATVILLNGIQTIGLQVLLVVRLRAFYIDTYNRRNVLWLLVVPLGIYLPVHLAVIMLCLFVPSFMG